MKFAPGSVAWLVAFDLRLALDRFGRVLSPRRAELSVWRVTVSLLLIFAVMHLVGLLVVVAGRASPISPVTQWVILNLVIVAVWFLALGATIYFATALLFIRGDMDLLCSSPVPTRNIFMARALSIALQGCSWPAFVCLPAADVAAFFGDPRWLAAYPVTLALGLSAAAAGLLLTVLLVRLIGPRRARTFSLVLSAIFGVSWFVAVETPAMLGDKRMHAIHAVLAAWIKSARLAGPDSVLWYPARAVQGNSAPLVFVLLTSLVFFVLVARFLPRVFLFALQRSADVPSPREGRTSSHVRFHRRFGVVVFLKEWRLIFRDPWLLTRLGRTLIFLVVGAVILLHASEHLITSDKYLAAMIAAGATFYAGALADMLVWLAICAEDMPDLIGSAPRDRFQLLWMKLFAMLAPIWGLTLIGAVWMAWFSLTGAVWLVVAVAGITLGAGFVHLLNPVHASRTDLNRRMRATEGIPLMRMILSALNLFGWCAVAFCFPSEHWFAGLIALVVVVGIMGTRIARGWNRAKLGELVMV